MRVDLEDAPPFYRYPVGSLQNPWAFTGGLRMRRRWWWWRARLELELTARVFRPKVIGHSPMNWTDERRFVPATMELLLRHRLKLHEAGLFPPFTLDPSLPR